VKTRALVMTAALTALGGVANAQSLSFSTPFTPGTPSSLQASWSGNLDALSPTWRRTNGSSSETAPTAPTTLGGTATSAYPYGVQSFTPSVSGLYQFYSAQSFDGYLHLYENSFDALNGLTNIRAADDDMGTLNGGAVPNRNSVATTNDSGFQFNLNAGTTYHIVTSTFSAAVPAAPGAYYNEVYGGGTSASPSYSIPDNSPTGVTITLNVADTRDIVSFDSVALTNLIHSYVGDLTMSLKHVDTGTTVNILDRTVFGTSNGADLNGNYLLADGGAALPTSGVIPGGTYGTSNALSAFVGESVGGTWELFISDSDAADLGSLSAFGINVTVPAPGALALVGLSGLIVARRRR
jgi:hypothetical protein